MKYLALAIIGASTVGTACATTAFSDTINSLHEVVVTGTNHGESRNLLPYTVSVVGDRQLQESSRPQLLSTLSGMVPSLFVTQRGIFGFGVSNGGAGHIKLRGVGGDRASGVLMMVDGQPQFAGIYSHQISDFYSKDYVERVEVLRGPGSVLYGSNAMAGNKRYHPQGAGRSEDHTAKPVWFVQHLADHSDKHRACRQILVAGIAKL